MPWWAEGSGGGGGVVLAEEDSGGTTVEVDGPSRLAIVATAPLSLTTCCMRPLMGRAPTN